MEGKRAKFYSGTAIRAIISSHEELLVGISSSWEVGWTILLMPMLGAKYSQNIQKQFASYGKGIDSSLLFRIAGKKMKRLF